MHADTTSFAGCSDEQLTEELARLVIAERAASAALISSLIEFDTRRLYLSQGCSSLFTYCTQVLHLAEGAAYDRIEAARAARRFPLTLDLLASNDLTLTAIRLLAPHLTTENHQEVLAAALHKSKREIELQVAALHPQPPVRPVIRKLPQHDRSSEPADLAPRELRSEDQPPRFPPTPSSPVAPPASVPSMITALAPERYKLQLTMTRETHEKFRRAQDLLRHAISDGDPATILDRALTALLEELDRRRFAATSSPRRSRPASEDSRHIPAAVRREVWRRDDGRCAFVDARGR